MRRLTEKSRRRNIRHAFLSNERRLRFKLRKRRRTRRIAIRKKRTNILCPSDFSLESNFDGVVDVIEQIRSHGDHRARQPIYINLRKIEFISPSAALVFTAELDRFNRSLEMRGISGKLRAVDAQRWNDRVYCLLKDMGFFDLLEDPASGIQSEIDSAGLKFVKFRTGGQEEGQAILDLQSLDLEPLAGTVPEKNYFYVAISEAMVNAAQHAYPDSLDAPKPNWWLSASWDAQTNELVVLIYDQGIGIPESLPRQGVVEKAIHAFFINDHSRLIRAAHELHRSGSGDNFRGRGLGENIRNYIDRIDCDSSYRVLSLRGEYVRVNSKDALFSNVDHRRDVLVNHKRSLPGTLIEWKITKEAP